MYEALWIVCGRCGRSFRVFERVSAWLATFSPKVQILLTLLWWLLIGWWLVLLVVVLTVVAWPFVELKEWHDRLVEEQHAKIAKEVADTVDRLERIGKRKDARAKGA